MKKNNLSFRLANLTSGLLLALVGLGGCATAPANKTPQSAVSARADVIILREGDVVKITFPGAPNLDSAQAIRRDGKITLGLVGEVDAAGLTPDELKQKVLQSYAGQITTKEAIVTVQSSTFQVFVTGSVIHPGKVLTDHPLTALDAVMEAGGFDYTTANMKAVKITRKENGGTKTFTVNLKAVLAGDDNTSFYLKPGDILYVPERFTLY